MGFLQLVDRATPVLCAAETTTNQPMTDGLWMVYKK